MSKLKRILIIGAGPAGLTAAYYLSQNSQYQIVVLESDPKYVGGISKTVEYEGFRFDLGGHRFFSKSKEVNDFWNEVLPDQFMTKKRSSRIYFQNMYFSYPLDLIECLKSFSLITTVRIILSYIYAKIFLHQKPTNLEDWLTQKFGKTLYLLFFKTYTEKLWGRSCREISADWADQRIKGLSILSLLKNFISTFLKFESKDSPKSLLQNFLYPPQGPGMFWEACQKKCIEKGASVLLGHRFESATYREDNNQWQAVYKNQENQRLITEDFDHIISSMPLPLLLKNLSLCNDQESEMLSKFQFRDFIIVAIMTKNQKIVPDQWIYIHDSEVKVCRIQNYHNWSEHLVPSPEHQCFGMEYFCHETDDFWKKTDEEILRLAENEILKLKLVSGPEHILKTKIIRVAKAYPVYHPDYVQDIETIKQSKLSKYSNLHLVGRNGMHRYNNQDHSIMTAMLVVKNIITEEQTFDPWKVNQDAEYIE